MKKSAYILTVILLLSILFTNAQNYQWAHGFGGPNGDAQGTSIATDLQGNVYVTGNFRDSIDFDPGAGTATLYPAIGGEPTVFIAKYDSSGGYLWAKSLSGSPYGECWTEKIVVNDSGIYLTGHFFLNIDFDPGPGTAILSSIGGWSGDEDIFIAHYDLNGNYFWAKSMGGTGKDEALDMELDNNNNIYIIGNFKGTVDLDPGLGVASFVSDTLSDVFFARYDANGNYIWAHDLLDANSSYGSGIDLCYDEANNAMYIAGYFIGVMDFDRGAGSFIFTSASSSDWDGYIAKYDNNGGFIWAGIITGCFISDIKVSNFSTGDVTITGSFRGVSDFDIGLGSFILSTSAFFDSDFFFATYNSGGVLKIAKQIGNGNSNEIGKAISTQANSLLNICGTYTSLTDFDPNAGIANLAPFSPNSLKDIFFASYDTIGTYNWAKGIGGIYSDQPNDIVSDVSGGLYLTGYFNNSVDFDPSIDTATIVASSPNNTIFIAKYKNVYTGFNDIYPNPQASLVSVYPNPTTESLKITSNHYINNVSLVSVLGKQLINFDKVNLKMKEVNMNVKSLEQGVYYIIIKTDKGVNTISFLKINTK